MSLRRHWQVLLPWSVVIAYAAELYVHWHQLGNRVATHFSASGVANGWQSKDSFALTSVLIIAGTLAVCLVLVNAYGWPGPQKRQQLLAAYYGVAVFVGLTFWGLVRQNLHGGVLNMIIPFAAAFGAGALGYWIGRARIGDGENIPRP
ncbi:MAG: DUF1648 domain-containing protein [Acidobacteriota bacterium]